MSLRDQLEKVFFFSQGHNAYNKQLLLGTLLDFLNTIASIRPVIDAYAFKFRMMTPCCQILSLLGRPPARFSPTLCPSSKGVF